MHDNRSVPQPTSVSPQVMAELTARFFLQARDHETLGDRIARADTSVHIHFTDTDGVTLRLDRTPIEAEPRIVGHAEVELWGSAEKFLSYARGERHLAMAIMHGEVEWSGPVRKFLRIMPILRAFDGSVWRGAASSDATAT